MEQEGSLRAKNYLLWIDAVGGYWLCTGETVLLGQPGEKKVDVPILGDLSQRHARIRRDGESYLIEAIREVRVDGQPVMPIAPLTDGCEIALGSSVKLRFRRPHVLTGTARLDFISHHHTQPSVNAILLMADTCILGPRPSSHVVCRHWNEEVLLFRHDNELFCRTRGTIQIDGVSCRDRGRLGESSHVSGKGFAFHIETQ